MPTRCQRIRRLLNVQGHGHIWHMGMVNRSVASLWACVPRVRHRPWGSQLPAAGASRQVAAVAPHECMARGRHDSRHKMGAVRSKQQGLGLLGFRALKACWLRHQLVQQHRGNAVLHKRHVMAPANGWALGLVLFSH